MAAVCYIWYANSTSLTTYLISFCLVNLVTIGLSWVGATTLCTNWFPRKKGLVMGWVTMGNNLSTAFFVAIITFAMAALGMKAGLSVVGILFIICGILSVFIKDYPEQAGCYPDNIKPDNDQDMQKIEKTLESTITLKDVFTRKEVYIVIVSCGFLAMCTVGVVSQLVPRVMSFGYSQQNALAFMTLCALIGVVGSYIVGYWDQKWGTQKAMLLFALIFAAALICNAMPFKPAFYISIVLIGFSLGGTANFPVSFTANLFGRKDFNKAFAPINILFVAIRMLGFSLLALFTSITGSVSGAYICFAVLCAIGGILPLCINLKKYQEKHPLQN